MKPAAFIDQLAEVALASDCVTRCLHCDNTRRREPE